MMTDLFYNEDQAYSVQEDDLVSIDLDQIPKAGRYDEFEGCAQGTVTKIHRSNFEVTVRYVYDHYRTSCKPKFKTIRLPLARVEFLERAK